VAVARGMLFCWSQGAPWRGRVFRSSRSVRPNTRELCQSVCSSATYRIRQPSRTSESIYRASAPPHRSSFRPTGKPAGREGLRLSTTPTVLSLKRPFGDSINSHSRAGRSRSARRARGKSAPLALVQAGSALVQAVRRPVMAAALPGLGALLPDRSKAADLRRAAATSVPTRHQRTSANRRERTRIAGRVVRSRSARSDGFTTPTKTGAPRMNPRSSTSTTSLPARRRTRRRTTRAS
jgi:hypothetical protein